MADWDATFLPALQALLSGGDIYAYLYNPPWVLFPLIPFAFLPRVFLLAIEITVLGLVARKLGAKSIMETFTTERGIAIEFLPIPMLLDKVNTDYPLPEPPTYSKMTAAKVVLTFPHDPTTLDVDDPEQTKANHELWDKYTSELTEVERKKELALMRVILLRGIRVPESTDDWVKEQEFIGLKVPADPLERRLRYIETEVLSSPQEYEAVVLGVLRVSGVPEDLLKQMEASFRGSLGRAGWDQALRPTHQEDRAGVVSLSKVRASAGGHSERPHSKRIRRVKPRG